MPGGCVPGTVDQEPEEPQCEPSKNACHYSLTYCVHDTFSLHLVLFIQTNSECERCDYYLLLLVNVGRATGQLRADGRPGRRGRQHRVERACHRSNTTHLAHRLAQCTVAVPEL